MIDVHPDFELNRKNAIKVIENNVGKMPSQAKIFARQNCLEFRFNTPRGIVSQIVPYNLPSGEFSQLANSAYKAIRKPKIDQDKPMMLRSEYSRSTYPTWHLLKDVLKNTYIANSQPKESHENT